MSLIPNLKATSLSIYFSPLPQTRAQCELWKGAVLSALKKNFNFQEANFYFTDPDEPNRPLQLINNSAFCARVKFYSVRNERLRQWVKDPSSVPRELFRYALKLAAEAGNDVLYESLLAVLPDLDGLDDKEDGGGGGGVHHRSK